MNRPTRREKLRPVEFVVFAAVVGVFSALVIMLVSKDLLLAGIFGGVAFIVTLVIIATLMLAVQPRDRTTNDEQRDRPDHP